MSQSNTNIDRVNELLDIIGRFDGTTKTGVEGFHEYHEKAGYAKDQIKEMGQDALEGLLERLNDENPKVRLSVVPLLGTLKGDNVLYHLQRQLQYEQDPEVKKRIDYWIKKLKEPPKPKQAVKSPKVQETAAQQPAVIPEPSEEKDEGGLFNKLMSLFSSDDDGDNHDSQTRNEEEVIEEEYIRRCFVCSKKIKTGDTMILQNGKVSRSSGKKSQVSGPVFCSQKCQRTFAKNPTSWR